MNRSDESGKKPAVNSSFKNEGASLKENASLKAELSDKKEAGEKEGLTEKSQAYYDSELSGIKPCSQEEMEQLVAAVQIGDNAAFERLVEGNLYRVKEAAAFFATEAVPLMDLIQEGNIALFLALKDLKQVDDKTGAKLDSLIKDAMEAYRKEEENSEAVGEELKTKLNVIDEVCVRLSEELGRAPSTKEVADKVKMDEEDVKYLMRIALSAIKKE